MEIPTMTDNNYIDPNQPSRNQHGGIHQPGRINQSGGINQLGGIDQSGSVNRPLRVNQPGRFLHSMRILAVAFIIDGRLCRPPQSSFPRRRESTLLPFSICAKAQTAIYRRKWQTPCGGKAAGNFRRLWWRNTQPHFPILLCKMVCATRK